jgi:Tripartite tricarboxylate transporter TctB family
VSIKSQKDVAGGLLFTVTGVAFAWGASTYQVGTAARMGPGYFPLLLGVILAIMGAVITFQGFLKGGPDGDPIGRIAWKPLGFILGANIAFGAMLAGLPSIGLPSFGLIVGIYALTFLASLAGEEFKFKEVTVLATILAAGSYVVFIKVLGLQFPVWPAFIAG